MTTRERMRMRVYDVMAANMNADDEAVRTELRMTSRDVAQSNYERVLFFQEGERAINDRKCGILAGKLDRADFRSAQHDPRPAKPSRIRKEDQRFYLDWWGRNSDGNQNCYCIECGQRLEYAAQHVSHLLSRGAHPEAEGLRHHDGNCVAMCAEHHTQWEQGGKARRKMRCWSSLARKMKHLLAEELVRTSGL